MKKKFKFEIVKYASETDSIIRAICSHNEGKVPLCLDDFISYFHFQKAMYPSLHSDFCTEKVDSDDMVKLSKDGGKTWFMIVQEIEIHELNEDDLNGVLFTSEKQEETIL